MEAVVLVTLVAMSVLLAVGAAFGTLTLAMHLIDVGTDWTTAPVPAQAARSATWVDALPDHQSAAKQPLAA